MNEKKKKKNEKFFFLSLHFFFLLDDEFLGAIEREKTVFFSFSLFDLCARRASRSGVARGEPPLSSEHTMASPATTSRPALPPAPPASTVAADASAKQQQHLSQSMPQEQQQQQQPQPAPDGDNDENRQSIASIFEEGQKNIDTAR